MIKIIVVHPDTGFDAAYTTMEYTAINTDISIMTHVITIANL